jgi:predicted PurR-regulated permease PerM
VGAWLGAIPAVLIALAISPQTALLTVGAYVVINQIEANVLTPRIQSRAVNVHPLLIFLAVIAGAEIAGVAGTALAVPILAVLRVVGDFFAARLRVEPPENQPADGSIAVAPSSDAFIAEVHPPAVGEGGARSW